VDRNFFGNGKNRFVQALASSINGDDQQTREDCWSGVQAEGWIDGGPSAYKWGAELASIGEPPQSLKWTFNQPTYGVFTAHFKHWYIAEVCGWVEIPTPFGEIYFCQPWTDEHYTEWHLFKQGTKEYEIKQSEVDEDDDGYSEDDGDCVDDNPEIHPDAEPSWCPDAIAGQIFVNSEWDYNCNDVPDGEELNQICPESPIIVDLGRDGFDLTDQDHGVSFDLTGLGTAVQIPWTKTGTNDAWLTLDRNSNGIVDSGRELFGNFTLQPASNDPNGFRALARYDAPEMGGNNNGKIDAGDSIYTQLRLWLDVNRNGYSEPTELLSLTAAGVQSVELAYKEARRTDRSGNEFRYRAKVNGANGLGRWAYDVFFAVKR
jgi:hypothetical protein